MLTLAVALAYARGERPRNEKPTGRDRFRRWAEKGRSLRRDL